MIRPYSHAWLAGLQGEGLVADGRARFVFHGSDQDASPLSDALTKRRPLHYRGPVRKPEGAIERGRMNVRILGIERLGIPTDAHFICTLAQEGPDR